MTIISLFLLLLMSLTTPILSGSWTKDEYIHNHNLAEFGKISQTLVNPRTDHTDARLVQEIRLGDPNYGKTLPGVVAAFTNSGISVILHIPPGTHKISSNLTIPANITLKLERGGIISVSNNVTLTINGDFEAGLYQVFSCTATGKVIFGKGAVQKVYPEWWGAAGDGVTDDTAALNAAFTSGASRVLLTRAQYIFSNSLTIPSYFVLAGAFSGTTLKLKANSTLSIDPARIGWCALLRNKTWTSTDYDIIIRNITLDGNSSNQSQNQHGIMFYNAQKCKIENCTVKNIKGFHGISTCNSQRIDIVKNDISATDGDGIDAYWDSRYINIVGNYAHDITNYGSEGIEIEGRYGAGSGTDYSGHRSYYVNICNNTIDHVYGHGILVAWCTWANVANNIVYATGGNSCEILGSVDVTVADNNLADAGQQISSGDKSAIKVWNETYGGNGTCSNVTINGNNCSYASGYSISVEGSAGQSHKNIVVGNNASDHSTCGSFHAAYVTGLSLSNNSWGEATPITMGSEVVFANPVGNTLGYVTYSGTTPVGNVKPHFVGEELLLNNAGTYSWWRSVGTTIKDWSKLTN